MGLVWPLSSYTLSQGYTWNGSTGHNGIDMAAPFGTPIHAISDGVIISVGGDPSGFGNDYPVERLADGTLVTYGHASRSFFTPGQRVSAGQVIALVGSEGDSTGPHLHLRIQTPGGATNPLTYLQSGGASHVAGDSGLSAALMGQSGSAQNEAWDSSSIAAAMGLSQSLFDSNPELAGVLAEVQRENLTPDTDAGRARFTALLQNTNWYKSKTDQQRKWDLLNKADPAEAKQEFISALGTVIHAANDMGVALTVPQEWTIAYKKASLALTDDELKYEIAANFKVNKSGLYGGDAGKIADDIWKQSQDYGMPMNAATVGYATAQVLNGHATQQDYEGTMKNYAMNMFPAIKDQIAAGKTVRDVAQPYLSVYQQVLEQSPDNVDLSKDVQIRKALSYQPAQAPMADGRPSANASQAAPQSMPLWQFEQQLKDDPRWLGTDNAQKSLIDAGTGVLKSMGLVS